jgi:hypothetical protein
MSNESLYGLTTELQELEHILADAEVPEGQLEHALNAQNRLLELLGTKTDACVGYAQMQDDYEAAIKLRILQLNDLLDSVRKKHERYDEYVRACLQRLGVQKIQGKLHTISLRKPSVVCDITDKDAVPSEFKSVSQTVNIDKNAIKQALKDGKEVSGAQLVEGKISVQYKVGKT